MSELKGRIKSKYDDFDKWSSNNPVLLKGESAAVVIPNQIENGLPVVLLKIGDGVTNFNELNWISALASDVFPWAKAENKPDYAANEIQNLENFILERVKDTNTTYRIVKGTSDNKIKLQKHENNELEGNWVDVGEELTIVDTSKSTVTFTSELEDGNKIGTINIDGKDTVIYSPKQEGSNTTFTIYRYQKHSGGTIP